ncbi:unnamed protein product [Trichobilharzia szidati]|nr:unnamed protein product [Trichobilharzia szidati]
MMRPPDGGCSPHLPRISEVNPHQSVNSSGHVKPTTVKCILIGDRQVGKTSLVVSYTSNDYPAEYKPSALDTYCVEVCADTRPVHLQICDAGGKEEVASLRHLSYLDAHVILLCFSVVRPESFRSLKTVWLKELATAPIILNSAAEQTAAKLFGIPTTTTTTTNATSSSSNTKRSLDHCLPALLVKSKSSICPNRGLKSAPETATTNLIPGPTFLLIGCACDLRNDIGRLLELSKIGEEPVDKEKAECLAVELGAEAYVECSALTQKNLKTVFDLAIWCGLKVADSGGPLLPSELKSKEALPHNGNCTKTSLYNRALSNNNNSNHVGVNHRLSSVVTTTENTNKCKTLNKKGWRRFLCINS